MLLPRHGFVSCCWLSSSFLTWPCVCSADEYIADYLEFSFEEPSDDVFRVPSACEDQIDIPTSGQLQGFTMQMLQLLPSIDTGGSALQMAGLADKQPAQCFKRLQGNSA